MFGLTFSRGMGPALALLVALSLGAGACRLNPPCFGSDECPSGLVCTDQRCADPGALRADVGVVEITWERQVRNLVSTYCVQCHSSPPQNGALMPLIAYEDTQQLSATGSGDLVYRVMADRAENLQAPMPPRAAGMLAPSQIRILRAWANAGAPRGQAVTDAGVLDGSAADAASPNDPNNPVVGAGLPTAVRSGFSLLDGVSWVEAEGVVLVSDVGQNRIQALIPGQDGLASVLSPSGGATGMESDSLGLVVAQQGRQRIARLVSGAAIQETEVASTFSGMPFNAPNDVAVRSDGSIYFTDPGLGLGGRPRTIPFNGVFRVPGGGGPAQAVWQGPENSAPNGLAITVDGGRLYLSDTAANNITVFDLSPAGELLNGRTFARTGPSPNGLTLDMVGNVYVTTQTGVEVYSPTGVLWGALPIPETPVNDLDFGGQDYRTLFVTTNTTLYSLRMTVRGTR